MPSLKTKKSKITVTKVKTVKKNNVNKSAKTASNKAKIKMDKHQKLREILKNDLQEKQALKTKSQTAEFGDKYLSLLLEGKKMAKQELLCDLNKKGACINAKELNKTPFILIFASDLNGEKELINREDLFKILEGSLVLNAKIIVINTQQPSDLERLSDLQKHHDNQIIWYNPLMDDAGKGSTEKEIDRLLLAADLALVFTHHLELIYLLMNYGVVVVGDDKSPLLENYKPNEETGNAFVFPKKDAWNVFAAMVRALETYKFPYDWKFIVKKIYK